MQDSQKIDAIKSRLSSRRWRLNNLYYITDKKGNNIKFKMNLAQEYLYSNMHYFNVILKARQLGFTTFLMIYFLDACLFNENHKTGVIAHTLDDAKDLFRNKIKYAYDRLPEWLRVLVPAKSNSARTLEFTNGSSIKVGTSLRGGTLQKLHVSEYGKISAKYPEKAKEIKTGALNTIADGQQIFIESTAEGKAGEFYDVYEVARKLSDTGVELSSMQPKSFFFPWFLDPLYSSDDSVVITAEEHAYFNELENQGVTLTEGQKRWYVLKKQQQGEDMTQEYPSTPDEAFAGSMKGAFYTDQMKHVRENKQICHLPYDRKHPVLTWWDLGLNDMMTVMFTQHINGKTCVIDYHESGGQGWEFYAKMLADRGYNYKQHNFPHDGGNRIRGKQIKTDKQMAEECGIKPVEITPRTKNAYDDIRNFCMPALYNCYFDEEKCAKLINHLDNYRRKWSAQDGMYMKKPEHDESSHGADAFRTYAVNADNIDKMLEVKTHKIIDPFKMMGGSGYAG